MRIMGLDLSIARTGIAFPAGETMAVKPRSKGDQRLHEIAQHVRVAARTARADLVVMEGLGGVYRGEAARVIPMLHGAVRSALMDDHVPYMADLSPSSLKLFATGSGGADKLAMRTAARVQLGRVYATDDECDADWLRIAGRVAYGLDVRPGPGMPRLVFTQARLDALRVSGRGKQRKHLVWPAVGPYTAFAPAA
jgi:Holliday junction resolvasome RuvABC endonuclease subunit